MPTLIKAGKLFDATGDSFISDAALLIDGKLIIAVGPIAEVSAHEAAATADIIDASSGFVMPGLINMHEHVILRDLIGNPMQELTRGPVRLALNATRNCLTALRAGWTTVRDMGASHNISIDFRTFTESGALPGPRIVACGAPLAVTGGHAWAVCTEIDSADEARKAARREMKAGADFIKVMASHDPVDVPFEQKTQAEMTFDEIRAAFEVAQERGRRTACHVMGTKAIDRVLDAGVNVISHGYYLSREQAQRMREEDVHLDPTLSSYGRQTMNPIRQRGSEWASHHEPLLKPMLASFQNAIDAGVSIVQGTDTAGRYAEDIEMMREMGMRPASTLHACTRNAAQALGLADRIGTLEPGKEADIVVLNGNPLEDPYALESVQLVIKGGDVWKPSEITLESLIYPRRL